jgi:DNA-binding transcriptional ArsR family regulator
MSISWNSLEIFQERGTKNVNLILLDFFMKIYNYIVVDKLTATFTALSDPTRRAILTRLAEGPLTVNSIAEPFNLTQQAISKHLAYLEKAHLIEKRKNGRNQFCQLKPESLQRVSAWANKCREEWESRFNKLDKVLESMKREKRHE